MMQFLTSLGTNLVIVAVFAAVVFVGLKVAQSVFGAPTTKASAVEVAARLTSLPAASGSALRRRFARSLTSQFLVMPSGERHALSALRVRISPEDAARLAPDGDLDLIGQDGARLYATHARRQGWRVPASIVVRVETDPVLRPGWIPPARGVSARDDEGGAIEQIRDDAAWSRIGAVSTTGRVDGARPRLAPVLGEGPSTRAFTSDPRDGSDDFPTVNVGGGLVLTKGSESAVLSPKDEAILGRGPQSPLVLDHPEISTRHAAIRHNGREWQIMDLGSTNGTQVDGVPLQVKKWRRVGPDTTLSLAEVGIGIRDDAGTVHLGAGPGATTAAVRQGQ